MEELFEDDEIIEVKATDSSAVVFNPELTALIERAQVALEQLDDDRAAQLQDLLDQIEAAASEDDAELAELQAELEDFLYYANVEAP